MFARGSFVHQNCSNYALTNLLCGLCRFMWIIDLLVIRPSPHRGAPAPARLFTSEVLRVKECTPTLHPSIVFTLDLQLSLSRSLGVHHIKSHIMLHDHFAHLDFFYKKFIPNFMYNVVSFNKYSKHIHEIKFFILFS